MPTKKFESVEDYNAAYDELYVKAEAHLNRPEAKLHGEDVHQFILSIIGDRPKHTPEVVRSFRGDIAITCERGHVHRAVTLNVSGYMGVRQYFEGSNGHVAELRKIGAGLIDAADFLEGKYE